MKNQSSRQTWIRQTDRRTDRRIPRAPVGAKKEITLKDLTQALHTGIILCHCNILLKKVNHTDGTHNGITYGVTFCHCDILIRKGNNTDGTQYIGIYI